MVAAVAYCMYIDTVTFLLMNCHCWTLLAFGFNCVLQCDLDIDAEGRCDLWENNFLNQTETDNMPPVPEIKPPSPLTFGLNVSENWKLFKQWWQTYSFTAELEKQSNQYQVAMLVHCLSDEALKVYNGFHFDGEENAQTFEAIIKKFKEFAVGNVNMTYEYFNFTKGVKKRKNHLRDLTQQLEGWVKRALSV